MLSEWGHIPPCYCYRCPFGLKYPECNVDCADELDRALTRDGSKDVAAFIFEPVVGATLVMQENKKQHAVNPALPDAARS